MGSIDIREQRPWGNTDLGNRYRGEYRHKVTETSWNIDLGEQKSWGTLTWGIGRYLREYRHKGTETLGNISLRQQRSWEH